MHVAIPIRHDEHRRRITSPITLPLIFLHFPEHGVSLIGESQSGVHAGCTGGNPIPEFDFTEEGLGVRSFMGREGGAGFGAVGFGYDGVSSGGEDEEVYYHGVLLELVIGYASLEFDCNAYVQLVDAREGAWCKWLRWGGSHRDEAAMVALRVVSYARQWAVAAGCIFTPLIGPLSVL